MILAAFGMAAAAVGGYVYRSSSHPATLPEATPPRFITLSESSHDFSVTSYNVLAKKYVWYSVI